MINKAVPSAICLSKGTEHSMWSSNLSSVQFLPIMHIRRISWGSSRRSMSICLRSPAREPSSTLTHEYIHTIIIKLEKVDIKNDSKVQFYTNACLLRRSCSRTSAVNRFGRTSSNAATWDANPKKCLVNEGLSAWQT